MYYKCKRLLGNELLPILNTKEISLIMELHGLIYLRAAVLHGGLECFELLQRTHGREAGRVLGAPHLEHDGRAPHGQVGGGADHALPQALQLLLRVAG